MSVNTVTIHGNLGDNPELKTSQSGKTYCHLSIATEDGWGENKKTNWHRCTAFGKPAELISKYVSKGDEIVIQGSIDYSQHDGKYFTSILISGFSFCRNKQNKAEAQQPGIHPHPEPLVPTNQENPDDLPF